MIDTLIEAWEWLVDEYGQTDKSAAYQVSKLHTFQIAKKPQLTVGKDLKLFTWCRGKYMQPYLLLAQSHIWTLRSQ